MTNHSININDGHLVDRSVDAFHNKSNILFISGANYQSNGGWSLGAFYANYHCHNFFFFLIMVCGHFYGGANKYLNTYALLKNV